MPEWKPEILRRLAPLNLAPTREAEIVDELSQHLEDRYQEFLTSGQSEDAAFRAALDELKGEDLLGRGLKTVEKNFYREPIVPGKPGTSFFEGVLQDIRYGIRMLAKSPGFALVAILTLALGIGANAAIFQLIDAVRLRTLPVKDPGTLAIVHRSGGQSGSCNGYCGFTFPLWQQIRQRQEAFSSIAAWGQDTGNLANGGEVDNAQVIWVSGDFFRTLDVQPMLGRLISASDDQAGCAGGADLSYAFWQRRYGGAVSVIGKTLTVNGHPFPILGITPPSFYGVSVGERFDVAVPICSEPIVDGKLSSITDSRQREQWWLSIFGRLKPGWTLKSATAQLAVIEGPALHETIPPQYDSEGVKRYLGYEFTAEPAANGFSYMRRDDSNALWLLLGLSGLVLLIACANLANLMLARATPREREVAVRLALGASRGRLIRQMLSESALLAIAGALCGGLLAAVLSQFLVAFISTPDNPIFLDMPTDWRVLGFAAGLAILTTVLFGLAPALRSGSVPPGSVLKTGGRGMTAGRERFRVLRVLVASQVALSLVLLAGALLFARSLRNLLTRNPGFQENGILIANVDFTRLNVPDAQQEEFTRNLLEHIRAIPGVAAAATSTRSPVSGSSSNDGILDKNGNRVSNEDAWEDWVSPGYFKTIENTMIRGRDFKADDSASSPKVAIVNQTFVKQFLNGAQNPISMQFRVWNDAGKPPRYYSVVGEVKDSVYGDMHDKMWPVMYFPQAQIIPPFAGPSPTFLIRSRGGMAGLLNSVKDTIAGVNPEIDIQFELLSTQISESLIQDELMATLCGFFGVLAVLLAVIGLYGVISYTVVQRTNEIGIRMALGAQRSVVIRLILGEVSILIGVGIAVGAGLTLAGGKAAGSLLYGLKAHDPVTLVLAVIILAAIGLAASFFPAHRASRLDPMAALKYE
jgi:putative ABC transport system permease protein